MLSWKRLRTRLMVTYVLLALMLLGTAGVVFNKALASYTAEMQARQWNLAFQQLMPKWKTAGTQVPLAPEDIQRQAQELLPGWQVSVQAVPLSEAGIPPEKLGYMVTQGDLPTVEPGMKSPLPGLFKMLASPSTAGFGAMNVVTDIPGKSPTAMRISVATPGAAMLQIVFLQVLFVLAVALVLAGFGGWWFSRWITRPLDRLAGATAAVAGGDFLQTVETVGIAELDGVAAQFNSMVGLLRVSFSTLAAERDLARRFAADAAHELRTPVTAMRTYQEVWAEHPERAAQMLPAIGRQVQRLERVIGGLLQLAALTEGSGVELVPTDLGAAVGALAPGLEALAEESGHRLTVVLPGDPVYVGLDGRLLEQIVYNLMDNACKYTPPGGHLKVTVTAEPDGAGLHVCDTGPGIDPAEVPRLFERFHRGIETQSIPGAGLGLAIVQEAVTHLGGRIDVDTTPGEGSCFQVRLPLLSQPPM